MFYSQMVTLFKLNLNIISVVFYAVSEYRTYNLSEKVGYVKQKNSVMESEILFPKQNTCFLFGK